MRIGVIGINHKMGNLRLRELLAKAFQHRFSPETTHLNHCFVLLSTCNRTEVYFASENLPGTHGYILSALRQDIKDIDHEKKLYSYFGYDCFFHLSRVTAGLDSAIVGETEIQGQVKIAYEQASQLLRLPSELHYLFQKALKVGKKIRTEFSLNKGMPNLEHAIHNIGSHRFSSLEEPRILFVGASDINRKAIHLICDKGWKDVTLCNRSYKRGAAIVEAYDLQQLDWSQFSQWHNYDWIIFGTKAPDHLLSQQNLPKNTLSPKLIMDLCVPRNVDPSLNRNPQITLLNIDQINRLLNIRKKRMHHTITQAETVVDSAARYQVHLFKQKEAHRLQLLAASA